MTNCLSPLYFFVFKNAALVLALIYVILLEYVELRVLL